jgi:hypothetical protein
MRPACGEVVVSIAVPIDGLDWRDAESLLEAVEMVAAQAVRKTGHEVVDCDHFYRDAEGNASSGRWEA